MLGDCTTSQCTTHNPNWFSLLPRTKQSDYYAHGNFTIVFTLSSNTWIWICHYCCSSIHSSTHRTYFLQLFELPFQNTNCRVSTETLLQTLPQKTHFTGDNLWPLPFPHQVTSPSTTKMESSRHTYDLRQARRPSRRAQEINPAVGNRVDRRGRARPIRIRLINRPQAPQINPQVVAQAAQGDNIRYMKTYSGPLFLYCVYDRAERRYVWNWNTDRYRPITQFWHQGQNRLLGLFDKEAGEFIYRHPKLPAEFHDAYVSFFGPSNNNAIIAAQSQAVANVDAANDSDVQIKEESDDEAWFSIDD